MREFGDWETKYEKEPMDEPNSFAEYPPPVNAYSDGWDSVSEVPFAGDDERNGVEGSDLSDASFAQESTINDSELSDSIEDIPEDVFSDGIDNDNLSDNLPDTIPEDVNGDKTDIQGVDDISGWVGDINPNYDAFDTESDYSNNCGSCAYAVFQRLEGNPDACASAENIPYNEDMEALTGMEQVSMDPSEIEQRLLEEGDGAHAIIGIDRAEGPGHWFNAACVDGKVVAIDGQTGEITDWPPDYGDVVNWEMSVKKGE